MADGGDEFIGKIKVIAEKLRNPAGLRVGFINSATYPDGTSVALVAAINEFGAPSRGQPPRPFFRNMIAEKKASWPKAIGDLLKDNNYDVAKTLDQAGLGIEGQLRQSIADFTDPPLAQSTIDAKGFDKPLVDTGLMLNSISHSVDTE